MARDPDGTTFVVDAVFPDLPLETATDDGTAVDIDDSGGTVEVAMDLPDRTAAVETRLDDDRLRVRAERAGDDPPVSRTVELPSPVDEATATATHRNGVLTVTARKDIPFRRWEGPFTPYF